MPLDGTAPPEIGELALELLSGYGALNSGETVAGRLPEAPLGEFEDGTGKVALELSGGEGKIVVLSSVAELRVGVVVKEVSVAVEADVSVNKGVEEIALAVEYEEEVPDPKPVTDDGEAPVDPASLELVTFDRGYGAVLDVPISVAEPALAPEL